MTTTVAIAGISSALALLITKSLLQRPDVHIRGSSRDIDKLPDDLKSSSRVTLVQSGPYDTEKLRKFVRGCDAVVCCYYASSEVMLEGQRLLIDLCEAEGITRYIASDYTADFRKLDQADLAIKNFAKDVKEYLDTKSTVRGVHILVGIFMETFLDFFGVWNTGAKEVRYWGTGNEKWDLTSYQTGADYVAAVTLDPNASGFFKCRKSNSGIDVTILTMRLVRGDHKSAAGVADDIESVLGFRPVLQCNGPLTDIAKQLDGVGNIENTIK